MTDLQELIHEIEQLPLEDFNRLRQLIEEQAQQRAVPQKPSAAEVDAWMSALDAAVADLRQGLSESELQQMIEAMNYE